MCHVSGRTIHGAVIAAALSVIVALPAQAWSASFIREGSAAKKPYGHHVFCQQSPRDCRDVRRAEPETLSKSVLNAIRSVNTSVNRSIRPVADEQTYGTADVWSANVRSGDCEDYAIEKRRRLIGAGLAPANLRLTMVKQRNGEAHVVLAVRTSEGDMILDNLNDRVTPFRKTGYRFIKIQNGERPRQWHSIR